jgi:hypothetical protein
MSLTASEVRVLSRIEEGLLSRDPRLKSLFAIFTRLTRQEAMPAREQLRRRRWRPGAGMAILIGLVLAAVAVSLASLAVPAHACPLANRNPVVASAASHTCTSTSSSGSPVP